MPFYSFFMFCNKSKKTSSWFETTTTTTLTRRRRRRRRKGKLCFFISSQEDRLTYFQYSIILEFHTWASLLQNNTMKMSQWHLAAGCGLLVISNTFLTFHFIRCDGMCSTLTFWSAVARNGCESSEQRERGLQNECHKKLLLLLFTFHSKLWKHKNKTNQNLTTKISDLQPVCLAACPSVRPFVLPCLLDSPFCSELNWSSEASKPHTQNSRHSTTEQTVSQQQQYSAADSEISRWLTKRERERGRGNSGKADGKPNRQRPRKRRGEKEKQNWLHSLFILSLPCVAVHGKRYRYIQPKYTIFYAFFNMGKNLHIFFIFFWLNKMNLFHWSKQMCMTSRSTSLIVL